jgi:hypothetical protein
VKSKRFLIVAFFLLFLCGCHATPESLFEYSNIVDADSQRQMAELLAQAGVKDTYIARFLGFANDFYTVPYAGIADKGFVSVPVSQFTHKTFGIDEMERHWNLLHYQGLDINCRVAAFVLMQDFISWPKDYPKPEEILDEDLLKQHYLLDFSAEAREKYGLLFNDIPYEDAVEKTSFANIITRYWQEAGVVFQNDSSVKLICLYVADTQRKLLQVAHAAALIKTADAYYLIEKYNPREPYQISKFSRTEDMIQYLSQRLNPETSMVVMKNDEPMD